MTDRIGLTRLVDGRGGNDTRWNESVAALGLFAGLAPESRTTTVPPAGVYGAVYIIPDSGVTGEWATHEGQIARYLNGWRYLSPVTGMSAWVRDEDAELVYTGTGWADQDEVKAVQIRLKNINGASVHEVAYTEGDWNVIDARSVLTVSSGSPAVDWSLNADANRSTATGFSLSVFGTQQTVSQSLGDPHLPIATPPTGNFVWFTVYGTSAVTIDTFSLTVRYTSS